MDTSELRVGNLLHYKEDTVIVSGINPSECFVIRDKDLVMTGIDNLNPIPLTEEWLLRFGFVDFEYESFSYYIENNGEIVFKKSGLDILYDYAIKNVHELQNLYFALTGYELQLK